MALVHWLVGCVGLQSHNAKSAEWRVGGALLERCSGWQGEPGFYQPEKTWVKLGNKIPNHGAVPVISISE